MIESVVGHSLGDSVTTMHLVRQVTCVYEY